MYDVGSSLAVGISAFVPGTDRAVVDVFNRADSMMYQRKCEMKS